jgi:hypothetical protein
MFTNRFVFLFLAKRLAEQRGATPDQSLRDALPVLFANPPLLGLFLAIALAQRETPPVPQLVNAQNAANNAAQQGNRIYEQVLEQVRSQNMDIPSFLGASKAKATRILTAMGLKAKFIFDRDGHRDADDKAVVIAQQPEPWSKLKPTIQEVTLRMGWVES